MQVSTPFPRLTQIGDKANSAKPTKASNQMSIPIGIVPSLSSGMNTVVP
jgi:hypothetical protein